MKWWFKSKKKKNQYQKIKEVDFSVYQLEGQKIPESKIKKTSKQLQKNIVNSFVLVGVTYVLIKKQLKSALINFYDAFTQSWKRKKVKSYTVKEHQKIITEQKNKKQKSKKTISN